MLKFKIHINNLDNDWKIEHNTWRNKESFLAPIQSIFIENSFLFSENKCVFIIREKDTTNPNLPLPNNSSKLTQQELDKLLLQLKEWNLELLILELDLVSRNITFSKGSSDKVANYYTIKEGFIYSSWEINDLLVHLDSEIFNKAELLKTLVLMPQKGFDTIYNNIFLLSERSMLSVSTKNSVIELPPSYPVYQERSVRNEKDIDNCFQEIIYNYIKKFVHKKNISLACELSGGLDSALIAVSLCRLPNTKISTLGMSLPGVIGDQQQNRRKEIINKFNLSDYSVYALDKGPLFEDGKFLRNGIFSIYDEIYQDSVIEMIECSLITDNGAVFTGIGGDELSLIYENIETSAKDNGFNIGAYDFINDRDLILASSGADLPNANISLSAIRSAQSRSPVFLRKNLWPINPLCCPDLVKFCQYLPRKIKAKKGIHRKVLENNGLSKEFTYPKIRENFNYVYEECLRKKFKNNILNLINHSKLHEMGYIDKRKLLPHYLMYSALGKSKVPALFFYLFAALEYNLEFISRAQYNFEQQSAIFN